MWASHGHSGEGTWSLQLVASDSRLALHSFVYLQPGQKKALPRLAQRMGWESELWHGPYRQAVMSQGRFRMEASKSGSEPGVWLTPVRQLLSQVCQRPAAFVWLSRVQIQADMLGLKIKSCEVFLV